MTVISRPCGPLSVTSRVDLSIAVMVAVALTVCTATPFPGAVPTIAPPVCAAAVPASATVTTKHNDFNMTSSFA